MERQGELTRSLEGMHGFRALPAPDCRLHKASRKRRPIGESGWAEKHMLVERLIYQPHLSFLSGKMQITKCDRKGRIYLKEALRSRYGDRFIVVEASDELVLLPVPDDPVDDLAELGQKLPTASMKQLRASILARAKTEVRG